MKKPRLIVSAVAVALALVAAIYGWTARKNPLLATTDGLSVDKRLRKSLPEGQHYEVIRWWPAKDSAAVREAEIALWESEVASAATRIEQAEGPDAKNAARSYSMLAEGRLRAVRESSRVQICRLKFRFKNERGVVVDQDQIYLLTDRQANAINRGWPLEKSIDATARAEFPE